MLSKNYFTSYVSNVLLHWFSEVINSACYVAFLTLVIYILITITMEYSDKLSFFQNTIISHNFENEKILQAALIHPNLSNQIEYINLIKTQVRLQFLGSSVFRMLVSELIYKKYPNESEGFLSALCNRMYSKRTMEDVAGRIKLSEYILMDPKSKVPCIGSCLSNGLSAVLAAMYLDGGVDIARAFVVKHCDGNVETWKSTTSNSKNFMNEDPKSKLISWANKHNPLVPKFTVIDRSVHNNIPNYVVSASLGSYGTATGTGQTKKMAEKEAAEKLLNHIKEEK